MADGIAGSPAGRTAAPRNCWYVVAFSREVTAQPLARRILDNAIVLYRTPGGQVAMLEDRCAHRAMPLSAGKLAGDRIQCPYHGMEYDPSGLCVRVPSQPHIPEQMRVRSFPVAERCDWIWGWMGDAALADESLIPDHSLFGMSEGDGFRKTARFVMHIGGNFQFLHENLLDVSHISFLHEGSLDSGKIAETPMETVVEGDVITCTRRVREVATGPFARLFGFADETVVDRELVTKTWVPNLNVVTNTFTFPDDPTAAAVCRHSPFAVTPINATSCLYFVVSASNYGPEPTQEEVERLNAITWEVFQTDKVAIEAIQATYLEMGDRSPDVSVRADEAALRFRRVLAQRLAAEASVTG